MSRTGNLLFPPDEDDGWVASVIKALPEKKPDKQPVQADIADPVAGDAESAFAALSTGPTGDDWPDAHGWSAQVVRPEKPADLVLPDAVRDAFAGLIDPVAVEAEAAFVEPAPVDDPVARWAAQAFEDADKAIDAAAESWAATAEPAAPATDAPPDAPPDAPLAPPARAALDAVVPSPVADPVAGDAERAFEDAFDVAAWTARVLKPVPDVPPPATPDGGAWRAEVARPQTPETPPETPDDGAWRADVARPEAPGDDAAWRAQVARSQTPETPDDGAWRADVARPEAPGDDAAWRVQVARPETPLGAPPPQVRADVGAVTPGAVHDPVAGEADRAFEDTARWQAEVARREAPDAADAHWAAGVARTEAPDAADADWAAGVARTEAPDAAEADWAAQVARTEAPEAVEAEWAAQVVRPETPLTPDALAALDAVVPREGAVDDPVAAGADAAFGRVPTDLAAEDAWSPGAFRAVLGDDTPAPPPTPPTAPSVAGVDTRAFADMDDLVALGADATFADIAADIALRDAVDRAQARAQAAGKRIADEPEDVVQPDEPQPGPLLAETEPPLGAEALSVLDRAVFGAPAPGARPGPAPAAETEAVDPVALAAEARFADIAAEGAITDALFATQWRARVATPADVIAAESAPHRDAQAADLSRIDDLVSAEAEIAFEDIAYDIALSAVDALVTGEAAALAAFDRAIAAGADPEEALAAAIAAAEAADPLSQGVRQAAVPAGPPGDLTLVIPGPSSFVPDPVPPGPEPAPAAAPVPGVTVTALGPLLPPAPSPVPQPGAAPGAAASPPLPDTLRADFTIPPLGRGFFAGPVSTVLIADAFLGVAPGFRFFLDPDLISLPRAAPRPDRDDAFLVSVSERIPIVGTAAADLLVGTEGDDAIGGREGDDYLYGDTPTNFNAAVHDAGNPLTDPTFNADGGDDAISGGAGDDTIWGGAGDDQIHGDVPETGSALAGEFAFTLGTDTAGDDEIHGGAGADTLIGGGGADTLYGDSGDDNIFGYAGDDVLVGGTGADSLEGGAGADEFVFEGGSGSGALARAQSLGTDTISDYSDTDGDTFALSDADFGLGAAGTLTDGTDYFETALQALSGAPVDASGGNAGPAIVVMGATTGTDGVAVYYTDDASAMTESNSYQIADVAAVNRNQIEAGDFDLRA